MIKRRISKSGDKLDSVVGQSQNQRGVRTILLAAAALAVLTGCQSAAEKQRQEKADSGDLSNCARIPRSVERLWEKLGSYRGIR